MQSNDSKFIFTDANKLISRLTQLAVNKNNVFRGYGKQSELLPNVIREKDWSPQEISLLYEFEKYGLQYFLRIIRLISCRMLSIMGFQPDCWILPTIRSQHYHLRYLCLKVQNINV